MRGLRDFFQGADRAVPCIVEEHAVDLPVLMLLHLLEERRCIPEDEYVLRGVKTASLPIVLLAPRQNGVPYAFPPPGV
jgi:hypothetical protein